MDHNIIDSYLGGKQLPTKKYDLITLNNMLMSHRSQLSDIIQDSSTQASEVYKSSLRQNRVNYDNSTDANDMDIYSQINNITNRYNNVCVLIDAIESKLLAFK